MRTTRFSGCLSCTHTPSLALHAPCHACPLCYTCPFHHTRTSFTTHPLPPPQPLERQTPVKPLPSQTSFAGGNKENYTGRGIYASKILMCRSSTACANRKPRCQRASIGFAISYVKHEKLSGRFHPSKSRFGKSLQKIQQIERTPDIQ